MNEAQAHRSTEEQMALEQRIEAIGAGLMRKVDEQVSYRVSLERRWVEDLYQYNGQYDPETQARLEQSASRSRVFVNVTRPKANAVEASLVDMLYPTDDKNYGIRNTPVPELQRALKNDAPVQGPTAMMPGASAPLSVAQQAQALLDEAEDRAEEMEKEIDDQLKEAGYNAKSRDVIHDAVVLGTGVIKAPVVVGRTRQSWRNIGASSSGRETHVMEVIEDHRPSAERVSPWDFFPDMSAIRLEQAEFTFERHYMTAREVRQLAKNPGFQVEQIRKLLKEQATTHRSNSDHLDQMRAISGLQTLADDTRFEIWEYHGPIDKEDLVACGCEEYDEEEDPMDEVEGVVWFCGPHVLKAVLNPMESDERPYSVFCWEEDDTSIYGFGVPYQARNAQRVINSTWRMILDNGGLSVGPQVVIDSEQIEPADNVWEIRGGKVWWKKGGIASMDQAFKLFDVPSRQNELERIFLTAMRLVDEETSTPMTMQGEHAPHLPDTARGMSILMNNSNAITRRAVKNFDDHFTVPVIRRFYHWNMQFNEKDEIKGDFEPVARGTAALLVKEQQQQALLQFLAMTANPNDLPLTNRPELLRKTAQAMHLDADDAVLTDEEIEALQKQMREAGQANPDELRYQHEYKMHQEKLADLSQEREARMMEREIDREIAITKMMTEKDISYQQIEARLKEMLVSTRVKRQNAVDEMTLKTQMGQGI